MKFLLLLLFCPALLFAQNSSWIINANSIDPTNYYGETVANGVIGIISAPKPFSTKEIVLNGAFDQYGRGQVSNMMKVFNFMNFNLEIDGIRIERLNQVQNFHQELDLKKAVFITTLEIAKKVKIKYSYYALRQLPFNGLIDIEIEALDNIEIAPASVIEAPDILRNVQNYYSQVDRPHAMISYISSVAQSPTGKLTVAACNSFIFPNKETPNLIHEMWDDGMHLLKFKKQLKSGEKFHFAIIGATISSVQSSNPLNEAARLTMFASTKGLDNLIKEHTSLWDQLWESDIQIEGDPQAQLDVRSMLYHLYSFVRANTSYGLSPMGLSGLEYNGHSFWDTEIWMYPALLQLHPDMAKSLLEYRFNRLEAAKRNAMIHGYAGAMFPWESADTGEEETPVWALSGPYEHHITADIAIAAWNYFLVTKDTLWLKTRGWPIVYETANFWKSRVSKNNEGKFEIKDVVAADEWAENVDNNAYTNVACMNNLIISGKCASILGLPNDTSWNYIAKNIRIDTFSNGVIKEYSDYNGQKIKQADVNLLAYPLNYRTTPNYIKKDLDYYEPRVGDGPAMTHAIFSLLYTRINEPEKALDRFNTGYKGNLLPPFNVIAETKGGTNPYFATGAGGLLQAMLNGFGGLDITENGIIQKKTRLPKKWKSLKLTGIGVEKKTYEIKN